MWKKIFVSFCGVFISFVATAAQMSQAEKNSRLQGAVDRGDVLQIQVAIDDGATNAADILKRELTRAMKKICYVDFDVITVLLGSQDQLLTRDMSDDLIYQAIYYDCTKDRECKSDRVKPFSVKAVLGVSAWDYEVSEQMLEQIASIAASNDNSSDVVACVFDRVSKNKLAGVEFFDVAGRVAGVQNAANMTAFINNLRAEISNMRDGN